MGSRLLTFGSAVRDLQRDGVVRPTLRVSHVLSVGHIVDSDRCSLARKVQNRTANGNGQLWTDVQETLIQRAFRDFGQRFV